jgi:hypothetical protein
VPIEHDAEVVFAVKLVINRIRIIQHDLKPIIIIVVVVVIIGVILCVLAAAGWRVQHERRAARGGDGGGFVVRGRRRGALGLVRVACDDIKLRAERKHASSPYVDDHSRRIRIHMAAGGTPARALFVPRRRGRRRRRRALRAQPGAPRRALRRGRARMERARRVSGVVAWQVGVEATERERGSGRRRGGSVDKRDTKPQP